jgi:hypothetical protein
MVVRAFRSLALFIFLTTSVATLSAVPYAPAVYADGHLGGGGFGTTGDPDQPKDTSPRPICATSSSPANSSSMTLVNVSTPANESRGLGRYGKLWLMSEILLSNLIGRPGIFR